MRRLVATVFAGCLLVSFGRYTLVLVRKVVCGNQISHTKMSAQLKDMVSVDFEVFGRVQGVFFRKYTVDEAKKVGVKGWIMNTPKGTVLGRIEGEVKKVEHMKKWLQETGSPMAKVEKVEFKNEVKITSCSNNDFKLKN
ncbi:acylphosphatase-2-like isoform X1 [Schistocerca nitens]|uniref:acylphosphatase-2-like isoform X1 n=1 Tax=Schistocerca cancellata TaxID=274614 RepID=UPI002119983B|nr:acylphosphatase-2-like isoform X1 [Schistocerca cancellata]XP_049812146.1 acylphosphatase-2-like isoform X1 [Schistocerca nitens]XP_049829745.1 acylphosphatase-2-like isoform X1 [Schistocerca gregaria]